MMRTFTFYRIGSEWMTAEEAERKYGQGFIYKVEDVLELKLSSMDRRGRS